MDKTVSGCFEIKKPNRSEINNIVYDFAATYDLSKEKIHILADKYAKCAELVVAYYSQTIVGYIAYYRNDVNSGVAYITMVVVKEDYRKKGIASLMLKCVIDDCIQNGFSIIRLEVDNENKNAIALYKKFGFKFEKTASERSSYYRYT